MSDKYTITVEKDTNNLSFFINTSNRNVSIFLNGSKVHSSGNFDAKTVPLKKAVLPYGHDNPPIELPCEVVLQSLKSLVVEPQISEELRSSYENLLNDIRLLGESTESLNLSKITMT